MARRPYNFPSLNGLAAFEAAGRHMSFTAAASELNVTPGAVSKQIKQLESEVGTKLFVRLHRSLDLTAEGAVLLETLRESFSRISKPSSGSMQPQGEERQHRFDKRLCPVLADAAAGRILEGTPGHRRRSRHFRPRPRPLVHRVDLRIRYGTPPFENEEASKLFDDRIIAVASETYLAGREVETLTDLAARQLLSVEAWTGPGPPGRISSGRTARSRVG